MTLPRIRTARRKAQRRPRMAYRIQVLLTIENGNVTRQQLLRPDEIAMSLACFTELARRAGWTVTPPDTRTGE